jgi:predicted deacylase
MVPLSFSGIHGDEINGVEIVRQLITKKINKPKRGTIICIPVINMFGFLNKSRKFPDGRDLNRVFPGSNGSLLVASPITCLLTFYHWLITQLIFMQEVPV